MNRLPPNYIANYITNFHTTDSGITWKGQLVSSAGNTKFNINYFGELDFGLILGNDFSEELIIAVDTKTKEKIVLFDGCKHGHDNMFCDEFTEEQINDRPAENTYQDEEENSEFEIYITFYFNINYEEEREDFENENGEIELITGELISFEHLFRSGFDAYSLEGKTSSGDVIEISQKELA